MAHREGRFFAALGRFATRYRVLVVLFWVALAGGLNLLLPQLEQVVAERSAPFVPSDAPSKHAVTEMSESFGEAGLQGLVFVVLANEKGLSDADRGYYGQLVRTLRADREHVASIQDIESNPAVADAVNSRDGKAIYLPVGLNGEPGTPAASEGVSAVRAATEQVPRSPDLAVHVTGPNATVSDELHETETSIGTITVATVVLIIGILLLVYRSVVTAAIPLITIGVSLGISRAVLGLLGQAGLPVSTFTIAMATGVILGAGTDYAVFLISRYHEYRRAGVVGDDAIAKAGSGVAPVIVASAATVAAACACLILAKVGIFSTTGPGLSISVLVTLVVTLTMTPALLAIAARRGYAEPRAVPPGRYWRVAGVTVARRPVRVLALSVVLLIALAAFLPLLKLSFDERGAQPDETDSNVGYATLGRHYPANELLPDYVLVHSDRDLRKPGELAALEGVADAVAKVPGVSLVRAPTRPVGGPLTEASVGFQAGEVGNRLGEAGSQLAQAQPEAGKLVDGAGGLAQGAKDLAGGAGQLADGAGQLADGSRLAVDGAGKLLDGLEQAGGGVGQAADGAGALHGGAQQAADGARQLADALRIAHGQARTFADGLNLAVSALHKSPLCGLDPVCLTARSGLDTLNKASREQLIPGLAQLSSGATKLAEGNTQLEGGVREMRTGLAAARTGLDQLTEGQREFQRRLGDLASGADSASDGAGKLADGANQAAGGAGQLADGTKTLVGSTDELRAGLQEAAAFLTELGTHAKDPAVGGFYLPARAFDDPRLALASGYFISADGHSARMIVLGDGDPFDNAAMDRARAVKEAAAHAVRNTPLSDAKISTSGIAATNADLSDVVESDFLLVALTAFATIFLILLIMLRSIVVPIYLLASVLLSYVSAIGLAVAVWRLGFGMDLHWTVAPIAFISLVAVGADYNLLLVSRIRDEMHLGPRAGVVRAVTATGGVISTAGVIFAVSMFALMAGSVSTLAQVGFTIGAGLLIDTFIVRTLTVPAIAALLGKANWWPGGGPRVAR